MNHLENEGPTSAHFDLAHIESKAKEGFKERALAIGLAADGDDLRDGKLLAECDGGGLKAIVCLESRLEIGGGRTRIEGIRVWMLPGRFVRWGFGGSGEESVGGSHWRECLQCNAYAYTHTHKH